MKHALLTLLLIGCTTQEPVDKGQLRIDGNTEDKLVAPGSASLPTVRAPSGKALRVRWTSSDPSVERVSGKQVIAVAPGKITLTGTVKSEQFEWALTVVPPIHLQIDNPPAQLQIGQTHQLQLTIQRASIDDLSDPFADVGTELITDAVNSEDKQNMQWTSSDPKIATVTELGQITAIAEGWVFISVEHNNSQATVELQVSAP